VRRAKYPRLGRRVAGVPAAVIYGMLCGNSETLRGAPNCYSKMPSGDTTHAQRMLIENALSDAVRFFHMDALSSAVGLKVDFNMALLVIASGLCRLLAQRMRGYAEAQARHIFRDLVDTPANVTISERDVHVRFHRRAHLPIIIASGILNAPVTVPWWGDYTLRISA